MRSTLAGLLAGALLAGCGGAQVDWSDYSPDLKARIDAAAARHDCAALQKEFDTADTRSDAGLMTYIDGRLESAGCY